MAGRVVLRRAAINQVLRGPSGPVVRHIEQITRRTLNGTRRGSPVDEGTLRASFQSSIDVSHSQVTGRVWSRLEYAIYQLRGTGIYGPRHRLITPKNKRFLRFEVKNRGPLPAGVRNRGRGNRNIVFARFVRGTPPNPFLQEAFEDACPYRVVRHD